MVLAVLVVTKVSSCWISAFVAMFLVVMFAPAVNGSITNLTTSWWRRGFVASFVTVNTSISNVHVMCIGQYNISMGQLVSVCF